MNNDQLYQELYNRELPVVGSICAKRNRLLKASRSKNQNPILDANKDLPDILEEENEINYSDINEIYDLFGSNYTLNEIMEPENSIQNNNLAQNDNLSTTTNNHAIDLDNLVNQTSSLNLNSSYGAIPRILVTDTYKDLASREQNSARINNSPINSDKKLTRNLIYGENVLNYKSEFIFPRSSDVSQPIFEKQNLNNKNCSRAPSVNITEPQAVDTATYNPFLKFEDNSRNKNTDYTSFNTDNFNNNLPKYNRRFDFSQLANEEYLRELREHEFSQT